MKYLYVLLLTLTVNACSGQRNQKTEESNVAPPTFEMVSVPTLITDPDRETLINAAIAAVDDDMAFCDVLRQCIE